MFRGLIVLAVMLVLIAYAQTPKPPAGALGLVYGSDTPEVREYADYDCYVYAKYVVFDNINNSGRFAVAGRGASPSSRCEIGKNLPFFSSPKNNPDYCMGSYGDLLLVDSGTSAGPRGLTVRSLANPSVKYISSYLRPIWIEGGKLYFYRDVPKPRNPPPCPKAKQWEAQQASPGWDQFMVLDLRTLQVIATDQFRCSYRE